MRGFARVASRLEDLVVWRLGNELREKVHAITAIGPVSRDRWFCDQMRAAASSITSNVAEGFGRFRHKEFAQFLTIARGSLFEVTDHLQDGVARSYWTAEGVRELRQLSFRAIAATTRLIKFLRTHPDP